MIYKNFYMPLAGRDISSRLLISFRNRFLLTRHAANPCKYGFLLTRPSRGATYSAIYSLLRFSISTHTPLAGRDCLDFGSRMPYNDFYSHAPRGARQFQRVRSAVCENFYSHAPRGARHEFHLIFAGCCDFYSHAPRGARRYFDTPFS